jgi:hypothetical protein
MSRRRICVAATLVALACIAATTLIGGSSGRPGAVAPDRQAQSFAIVYRQVATELRSGELAFQDRALHAARRDPERLIALYRDARVSAVHAHDRLAATNAPDLVRPDVEALQSALTVRAQALRTLIGAGRADEAALGRAVRDLSTSTQHLRSLDQSIIAELARPTSSQR